MQDGWERVVRRLRQDYEGRKGPPRGGTPDDAPPEKKTLPPPWRAMERRRHLLWRVFSVVGRVVGYALLIVATLAVGAALGAVIAVAMEYLVG